MDEPTIARPMTGDKRENRRERQNRREREDGRGRGSESSRRTILRVAGTAGALAGVAGFAGVGELGRAQAADFELDGDSDGWVGRSPEAIAGRTNPTLNLEPGRTYRVTWTNVDGAPHSFVIEDADGNRLAGTEIADEEGASLTLEFEATSPMAEYYCEVHPESMRGQVAVGDGGIADEGTAEGGEATGETTADAETEPMTEDGPPPVIDEGTVVLGGQASHWLGLAPSGIQGRENPTLRLRAGRECELVWVNLDGVEHDFHLADAAGEDLADTSAREDVGDTHSTTFEATPEMAEYYCIFHRQSMRGSVEIV
jgi:plastocyanin